MPTWLRLVRSVLAVAGVLLALASGVHAQAYPTKPIHLIVPWPLKFDTSEHFFCIWRSPAQ